MANLSNFSVTKLLPARSVLAGGLGAIATWALVTIATHYGLVVPEDVAMGLVGFVSFAITHVVPDSVNDKLKWLDGLLKKLGDDETEAKVIIVPKEDTPVDVPAIK